MNILKLLLAIFTISVVYSLNFIDESVESVEHHIRHCIDMTNCEYLNPAAYACVWAPEAYVGICYWKDEDNNLRNDFTFEVGSI